MIVMRPMLFAWFFLALAVAPRVAMAWGDEGHRVIALIAQAYLSPQVSGQVTAMLQDDSSNVLTAHDIAGEATWADRLRDADIDGAKKQTGSWHFINLELARPDEGSACFGHPAITAGEPAYPGVAKDCVIDKIVAFRNELAHRQTPPAERLIALKFLLHFVGDMHQPLHAADDMDRGGNDKKTDSSDPDIGNLHAYWDIATVRRLGNDPTVVAQALIASITPEERVRWQTGTPANWAMETFAIGKADAYGKLPPPGPDGRYHLSVAYETMAARDTAEQLSKAGVRLAYLLNTALAPRP
jgi:hypothetical protein